MESKVRHGYDDSLKLQAIGSAAVTSDTTSTLVDINRIVNGRGDVAGRYAELGFDCVLHVVTAPAPNSNETYVLSFRTYDSAGANPVTHRQRTVTAADNGSTFVEKFDTGTLRLADSDAAKFGIFLDVSGTAPALTYWAFVAPNSAH